MRRLILVFALVLNCGAIWSSQGVTIIFTGTINPTISMALNITKLDSERYAIRVNVKDYEREIEIDERYLIQESIRVAYADGVEWSFNIPPITIAERD